MGFKDFPFPEGCSLFPSHDIVRQYLEAYSQSVRHLLRLGVQVLDVTPEGGRWWVITKEVATSEEEKTLYDAVVVSSGHYDDPFVPDVPGVKEWESKYPGSILHSKFYRRPEDFKGKVMCL